MKNEHKHVKNDCFIKWNQIYKKEVVAWEAFDQSHNLLITRVIGGGN